jgi:hypothetical protein
VHKRMYNVGYGIINQQCPWQMFGKEQIYVPKFDAKYGNIALPRKDTLSHWGTYWKCIHFIMWTDKCTDFNTPAIALNLQIPYIAITGVLSMLQNVLRGANVPPLMCRFEGFTG